jgi:NADH-quinone oxidoreductase subunit G
MPTFKLDGRDVHFEPGDSIMRAAWRQGHEIPHYCWHPGLSVAANCRMCLVHITSGRQMAMPQLTRNPETGALEPSTKPKLVPACQTQAAEGIEVSSTNDEVTRAQAAVQELLLLNHPFDCPICDQAGECKLQDYYDEHLHQLKRKRTEPVHKPKGVRFGPTIVYDAERCIVCTRCVRVTEELAHDPVLSKRERGNRSEIVLSPGRELDHRYTLMTEHVCPVGALTSRDFRFKARVWFLKSRESVCDGCARGCASHADFDPRKGLIHRLRPRDDEKVNRFWMCDDGMLSYKRNHEDRIDVATVGRAPVRRFATTDDALENAARLLRETPEGARAVVLSAAHSTEDNLALAALAKAWGASLFLTYRPDWEGDEILRSEDQNPNRKGATLAAGGASLGTLDDLLDAASKGTVKGVVVLGAASTRSADEMKPFESVSLVSLNTHISPFALHADVVVPVATHFERQGSFINESGLTRRFDQVVPPASGVRSTVDVVAALAALLTLSIDLNAATAREAVEALASGLEGASV